MVAIGPLGVEAPRGHEYFIERAKAIRGEARVGALSGQAQVVAIKTVRIDLKGVEAEGNVALALKVRTQKEGDRAGDGRSGQSVEK